nr:thioesterase family protein [Thermoanaerobacterales bacterium]
MHEFDRATAVRRRHVDDDGRAVHEVDVDGGWAIGDKPNGGYLLATAARAAADAAAAVEGPEHPHAVAATAAYLAPPAAGPAEVHSEVLRRGRGTSQVRARLVQDGAVRVDATFTLGRLRPDATPWWGGAPAPEVPDLPRERRTPSDGPGGVHLPIMERVDIRLDPATAGFTVGRPSGTGELRAVLRFADGRAPDPLALLYAVDALPPAPFEVAGTTGWVPTITLTAYVRALPADGPLVVRQRAGLIEAGTVDEVCEVWDGRGRLVAQATQLAAIRTAGPPPA